jgi:glycosyltransferase involved in cell wall biosynthesis
MEPLPYTGTRIVHAANFQADKDGAAFWNNDLKFHQGMIQSGCYVFPFSINDRARQLTWTNAKMFGMKKANKALITTCRSILPDALILGHGQHISVETLEEIRELVPGIRIGYWYVDPLWDPPKIDHLVRRAHLFDAICCTTGGELLKQFCSPGTPAAFIPNPVDPGIERLRAFESARPRHDLIFFGRDKHASHRGKYLQELKDALPEVRCDFFGCLGERLVFGAEKDAVLAHSRMGLNLSRRNDVALYSSDRIAQLTGNGILALVQRGAGIEELYSESEAVFYSTFEELTESVRLLLRDDERRRDIAHRGWEKAHTCYSSRQCAEFLLDLTFRRSKVAEAPWYQHTFWDPADRTQIDEGQSMSRPSRAA